MFECPAIQQCGHWFIRYMFSVVAGLQLGYGSMHAFCSAVVARIILFLPSRSEIEVSSTIIVDGAQQPSASKYYPNHA